MNKIHKSQYNESLGTWVAVPEIAKGRGKATGVAKEIPMTPSLPKFAISALTLALLQVVSVSAYGSATTGQAASNIYIPGLCSAGENQFACGTDVLLLTDQQNATAVGTNVYANMSTAVGTNITIGSASGRQAYNELLKKAKAEVKENNKGKLDQYELNKKVINYLESGEYDISSGNTGENSVAFGENITINTANTVALGSNIKTTKENSVFLGNNSGYISSDTAEKKDKKKSLGNAVAGVSLEDVKLSENLSYAGVNNAIGVVSVGNSEGTRRIQGVAPGLVSENSADAINGAQLSAAYDVIDDNTKKIAGNTTNINKNTDDITDLKEGWNIGKVAASDVASLDPIDGQKIKPGNTVNFADSDTVSVALKKGGDNNVAVQFDINPDQVRDKISTKLPIVYTDEGGNIVQRGNNGQWYKASEIANANADYSNLKPIGNNDIIASARNPSAAIDVRGGVVKLSNIDDGDITSTSKDAINGSQLYSVKKELKDDIAQGWNIGKVDVSALNGLDDITDKKIALGDSVKFAAADGVSVALKKVNDKAVAVQIGLDKDKVHADTVTQLPVVYTDDKGNIVQRGKDGKWYKSSEIADANGDYTNLTGIGDNDIIAAIHNPVGTAGKNISGNPFKLTNLDEGSVSAESKDAINGSQLFSNRVALAGLLGGGAAALTPDKKEGFTLNADGKKVPVTTLDGLMLDGDFQAPTFTVNKANGDVYQIGSGADAKDAVAHNVGDALENLNTYVNEGITVADNNGHSGSLAPTETLKFADGNKTKAKVSKQGNTVTVTVDVDSEAIASDVLTQGPVIYTVKNGSENAPVVKIDNKWYLAKDVTNNKPVAGAQAQAANSINASLRNPNAGATSAGAAYVLNNIADGVAPHDAINKRQFDYAVVYGDSSSPNYAETADHSFVAFKGTPVEVLDNVTEDGTTKVGTGTQLRNVASAGDITKKENAGHAVNAADLKYQVDTLIEKGLKFAGDADEPLVEKKLGETLKVTGDDNIKVAVSNGGLQVSIIDNPTFSGTVTANGGVVAGDKNSIKINTDGDGKIHGLTNVDIEKDGKSVLDNGDNGKSVAATEAQLSKVIAKIDGKIGDNDKRITEGRLFRGDIGDVSAKVGLGEALAVNGGIDDESKLSDNNIGVVTKDKGLEIKLGKNLTKLHTIELTSSDPNRDSGGNDIPSPTTDLDNRGITIKPNTDDGLEVKLTDAGLDNGGNKIVNVGPGDIGSDSTDAINGSQLQDQIDAVKKIIGGSVEYNYSSNEYVVKNPDRDGNGNPSGGIGGTGQITIDAAIKSIKDQKATAYTGGTNIKIEDSDDGSGTKVISTKDKVVFNSVRIPSTTNPNKSVEINGSGINAGDMKVRNVAAGRIAPSSQDAVNGSQLYQVKQDINEMDKRARSGIASAMASAGLPQAYLPGKSMVGAAASNYRGETAIAVGVSTISDNGKWLVKADANANRHDFGVSLGVGYQW